MSNPAARCAIRRVEFLKPRGWSRVQVRGRRFYRKKSTGETAVSLAEAEAIERAKPRQPKPKHDFLQVV